MGMWEKVVCLDRDGVVNEERYHESGDERNYVTTWEDFVWIPGSKEAIIKLLENYYFVVVVSNQACISKDILSRDNAQFLMQNMRNQISSVFPPDKNAYRDVRLVNLVTYICGHTEEDECSCRKPQPGMIYAAAYEHNLSLKKAWMIGNRLEDLKAGWAAKIRKLVRIEKGQEVRMPEHKWQWKRNTLDGIPFPDLKSAADFIIQYDAST